jgi:hypothetical protein
MITPWLEHAILADHAERQAVELLATLKWDGETTLPASDKWLFAIKVVSINGLRPGFVEVL